MLQLKQVARIYGDTVIFAGIALELGVGERLALVGENGSGKTTLLRVLAGLDAPDAGTVTHTGRVTLLAQHSDLPGGTVQDAVTPPELATAAAAFARASAGLQVGDDAALDAFAEAEERYRLLGGYDWEARAGVVLAGLNLDAGARTSQLSGGQMRRVMLSRLLLAPAEVYLLDEPTNHLDADGAKWLEDWILSSGAAFILASHDRAFLDAVATRTAELERGELHLYPGNYTAAMELKATLREAQQRDYDAYKRKRSALDEEQRRRASMARTEENRGRARDNDKFLSTHKAQSLQKVHAGRAQAMQKQIDRLDAVATAKPYDDHRVLRLDLPPVPPGPAEVLTVRDLSLSRGEKRVLDGVNLHVRRGDKVALVGPNGGGKSSLLRALLDSLLGELPHGLSSGGEVRWGAGLTVYSAGQHGEELRGLDSVGAALLAANPELTPHQLHEIAAQLGLPGPSAPLATLSGGQRTRLSLARLSVVRAQVLVLDEPTNHLDIRTIEALQDVLLAFSGTVLLASHDRRLVEKVCGRVWQIGGGKVWEN